MFYVYICENPSIWFPPLGTSMIGMLFTRGGFLGIFETCEFSEKFLLQICILELEIEKSHKIHPHSQTSFSQHRLLFSGSRAEAFFFLQEKMCFKILKLPVLCHNTNTIGLSITCQIFLRQMWWNFHLVMTEISENIQDFRRFSKDFWTLSKMSQNVPITFSRAFRKLFKKRQF